MFLLVLFPARLAASFAAELVRRGMLRLLTVDGVDTGRLPAGRR